MGAEERLDRIADVLMLAVERCWEKAKDGLAPPLTSEITDAELREVYGLAAGHIADCNAICRGSALDLLDRSEEGEAFTWHVQRCRSCGKVKKVVRRFDPLNPERMLVLRPGETKEGFLFPEGDAERWPDGPDFGCA